LGRFLDACLMRAEAVEDSAAEQQSPPRAADVLEPHRRG
jgi:hypothetical protein